MKKDIEWLKETLEERIDTMAKFEEVSYSIGLKEAYQHTLLLINQLDEPETLSEDWIQEHSYNVHLLGTPDVTTVAVPREDLQNQLVPKQEITVEQFVNYAMDNDLVVFEKEALEDRDENIIENYTENKVVTEKPTIPQFVADWIDDRKEVGFSIYQAIRIVRENSRFGHSHLREWLRTSKGQETFARAWLDGYEMEVEEEQKYYVLSKELHPTLCESAGTDKKIMESTTQLTINEKGLYKEQYALTEQEIKDYDERFWPFAVKVEEIENE